MVTSASTTLLLDLPAVPSFELAADAHGQVTMTAESGLSEDPRAGSNLDPRCLEQMAMTSLVIDLIRLECVDSRLVVWMLAIARSLPGVPVTIRAGRRAATQLRMLRLDSVFSIAS